MWNTPHASNRKKLIVKAVKFTGDAKLYGSFMRQVINKWPKACEHHLSGDVGNKKAWIGHAAACIAIQSPEEITRAAWGYLSKQQQDEANEEARLAIEEWELANAK